MSWTLAGNSGARLVIRPTPWDARALGRPTLDITEAALAGDEGITDDADVITAFHRLCGEEQAGLVTCRLPAERRAAIARLQAIGFRYVETVQTLRFPNLARFAPSCRPAPLRTPTAEDHPALIAQAAETFHFGRFAEDPAIPAEVNQLRQVDWMEGLLAGRATVLVTGAAQRPGAFMAFTTADGSADLVLGGTQPDQAVLALPFWTAVLLHLKDQGVRRIDTVVSAANIGVANLYARLGFQLTGTLVGLHLHRP
ncbi:hypothetical protein [Phreatobacter sp.]|uniref:hypothetical protein n=1 Tax=Phreatobacter sp. TaxID=1966341 RepID=UPI0022C7CC0F|nr:hypothetical protein [Phreatobacter sp.]MCZ8316200.1 hypothetical protein [Phreatobacter sp.]